MLDLIWLIPALPLLGFLINVVFGRILGEPKSGALAALMVGGSFVVTAAVFPISSLSPWKSVITF